MKRNEMRNALIQSAIHIVANEGIDKVKVDKVAHAAGFNVAYLYRIFGGKEGLFLECFREIDMELREYILGHMNILYVDDVLPRKRWEIFINDFWEFVLIDREKCSFFIKYYYSGYFDSYSEADRRQAYTTVLEELKPAFKNEVDVWKQLNYIYDILFSSVVKVLRSQEENTDEIKHNVYDFLYSALAPKFEIENHME